jgi:LysR family transcriptional regulator, glycine cleavage system transcriptional activator
VRYRLPPLNALRVFEAAARHLSFTRAGAELCVSQGAVSRHITILEANLGTKLFDRLHREVRLTEAGARYLDSVRRAFEIIDGETRRISPRDDDQTLRIKLLPTFAMRWLIPRLAAFAALHPEITVLITTSHRLADFDRGDLDASVEYGLGSWKGLAADPLFSVALVPVCSPRLADGSPPPARPEDLPRYVLLHSMQRPVLWAQWLQSAGVPGIATEGGARFQNSGLVYQAATDGMGIAITEAAYVRDDLEAGRLVAPFRHVAYQAEGYHLVYPPGKSRLRSFAAFRRWMLEQAQDTRRALALAQESTNAPAARPRPRESAIAV